MSSSEPPAETPAFRPGSTPAPRIVGQAALLRHCSDARYIWNLAVEQHAWWRPGRTSAPGYLEQSPQLTAARAASAGRWHVAFAHIPHPVPTPGTGEVVGVDRGVKVTAALSTGEMLSCPGLTSIARLKARETDRRKDWVEKTSTDLARRSAYTSQRCSPCGHVARENRESQAAFLCTARNFACNADVNAARNIAAGHAVKARGGDGIRQPVNREPQLTLLAS